MTIPASPKRQIAGLSIRFSSRGKVRCSASTGAGRSSGGHSTLVSHIASAKHIEFTNGDETFAKVKGWLNEMIAGLEEEKLLTEMLDKRRKTLEQKVTSSNTVLEEENLSLKEQVLNLTESVARRVRQRALRYGRNSREDNNEHPEF